MIIGVVEGFTRRLGPPPGVSDDDCSVLHIRDVPTKFGNQMVSVWEPTPKEVELLASGAKIYLFIYGVAHPMVSIAVGTHLGIDDEPVEAQK